MGKQSQEQCLEGQGIYSKGDPESDASMGGLQRTE